MKYFRHVVSGLLLLFMASLGYSQDVVYSEFDKFDVRNGDYSVVGKVGNSVFTYRNSEDGSMLESFDDSMNKKAKVLLDFFPNKIYETRFINYPDKIIALYQGLEGNKLIQYAALLDQRGLLKGKPIILGTEKVGLFGATKTYFYSAVSENKKAILIYQVSDKGKGIELAGTWMDDNLTVTKKSSAYFDAEETVTAGELNLDNDGTAYLAAYTPTGSNNYADNFWVLSLAPGEKKFVPHALDLKDKFAASGYMKVDNVNHKVYFGGFYADKKNGGFDGAIYAVYSIGSGAFINQKYIPFDPDLVASVGGGHQNHVFDNYEVKQIVVRNDGGFVLVTEMHYVTTRSSYTSPSGIGTMYSPGMSTMVREYHFNNILAISYGDDGNRQWSAMIHKQQYSQDDGGRASSYAFLNSGGTLAFIYNDFGTARAAIKIATIAPDGKTDVSSFRAASQIDPEWIPKAGKQVGARELVVPCLHKKQICYAKIVF